MVVDGKYWIPKRFTNQDWLLFQLTEKERILLLWFFLPQLKRFGIFAPYCPIILASPDYGMRSQDMFRLGTVFQLNCLSLLLSWPQVPKHGNGSVSFSSFMPASLSSSSQLSASVSLSVDASLVGRIQLIHHPGGAFFITIKR